MAEGRRVLGGRLTITGLLIACLTLLVPPLPGLGAVTDDEAQLRAREGELQTRIADFEAALADLRVERSQLVVEIDGLTAAIEGTADALEVLATSRREPARMRLDLALERFINGDPAAEAFTRELMALGNDAAQLGRQEVLGAVIESAEREIEEIDSRIRSLATTVPELQSDRDDALDRLDAVDAATLELGFDRDRAAAELSAVIENLGFYRNASGRSPLSGRDNPHGNARPALVVKIDNVPRARPQSGINDADVVFVELVEGGQTRLAAAFHSEEVSVVGPVRSMRTTDVKLLQMLNQPLFANSGGNQRTTQIVNDSPLVNIGHATAAGGAYYRNNGRPAPHNLYSSTAALRRAGGSAGGAPRDLFEIRRPGTELPNRSRAANGVDVAYQNTSVAYRWNGSGWERSQDGAAFRDTAGVRAAPETVIVQFTRYGVSPADRNSPEAIVTGTGVAWIFTEGRVIEGTWSKPRARNVTEYFDADGKELQLLPGRVWIELPRPGNGTIR